MKTLIIVIVIVVVIAGDPAGGCTPAIAREGG